jgi:hypothetical protein
MQNKYFSLIIAGFILFSMNAKANSCLSIPIEFGEKSLIVRGFLELASSKKDKDLSKDTAELLKTLEGAFEKTQCLAFVYESPKRTSMGLHWMRPGGTNELRISGATDFYWPQYPNKPLPEICLKKGREYSNKRLSDCYHLTQESHERSKVDPFISSYTVYAGSGNTMREALQDNIADEVLAYELSVVNDAIKAAHLESILGKVKASLRFFGFSPANYAGVVLRGHGYAVDLSVPTLWGSAQDVSKTDAKIVTAALVLDKKGLVFVDSQLGGPMLVKKKDLKLPKEVAPVGHDPIQELFDTMEKEGIKDL